LKTEEEIEAFIEKRKKTLIDSDKRQKISRKVNDFEDKDTAGKQA